MAYTLMPLVLDLAKMGLAVRKHLKMTKVSILNNSDGKRIIWGLRGLFFAHLCSPMILNFPVYFCRQ